VRGKRGRPRRPDTLYADRALVPPAAHPLGDPRRHARSVPDHRLRHLLPETREM